MKTGTKILILVGVLLAVFGITGTVWIHYLLSNKDNYDIPEEYYNLTEAEYLLSYLLGEEYEITSADQSAERMEDSGYNTDGVSVTDARRILMEFLGQEEDELTGLIQDSELSFLDQKKDYDILSKQEFRILYEYLMQHDELTGVQVEELLVLQVTASEDSEQESYTVITPEGEYMIDSVSDKNRRQIYQMIQEAEDSCIRVYVADHRILEYIDLGHAPVLLTNVWIEGFDEKEQQVRVFLNGYHKKYSCNLELSDDQGSWSVEGILADLQILQESVTDIILKSDVISAKVLAVTDTGVELENYGMLKLSEHYKIYKIFGELAVEPTSQILVGYNTTNFVVADGVIEAALITEPIKAENIRVALRNSDYSSLYHDSVTITSEDPYTLVFHDQEKTFEAGEVLELSPDSGYLAEGRIFIHSNRENGTITVCSILRNNQNPSYRGTIEVAPYEENRLLIINELPLEEYLYAVVPSEMPVSYGDVALQVQAICARGYAYMKMQDGTYAKYGAHLDDSTMTQVYHAVNETEESVLAVKETYGMVPVYQSEVIQAYFFSTSCGVTCNNADVWGGEPLPYLRDSIEGYPMDSGSTVPKPASESTDGLIIKPEVDIQTSIEPDLSSEEEFRHFIWDPSEYHMYEEEFPLYRWTVDFEPEELTQAVNSVLASRYEADPSGILSLQADGSYSSQPVTDLGDVLSVTVTDRGVSGIVKELRIEGTQATILVTGQTNARSILSPQNVEIHRQDDSVSVGWSMLPSPFYYIEQTQDGHAIIHGGGYGHGVGMSQNGAKALSDLGYSSEDIIKHYYSGIDLVNIYR